MSREITRRDFVAESVLASAGAVVAPACCGPTTGCRRQAVPPPRRRQRGPAKSASLN